MPMAHTTTKLASVPKALAALLAEDDPVLALAVRRRKAADIAIVVDGVPHEIVEASVTKGGDLVLWGDDARGERPLPQPFCLRPIPDTLMLPGKYCWPWPRLARVLDGTNIDFFED